MALGSETQFVEEIFRQASAIINGRLESLTQEESNRDRQVNYSRIVHPPQNLNLLFHTPAYDEEGKEDEGEPVNVPASPTSPPPQLRRSYSRQDEAVEEPPVEEGELTTTGFDEDTETIEINNYIEGFYRNAGITLPYINMDDIILPGRLFSRNLKDYPREERKEDDRVIS
jgi:hypothetical protein